MKRAVVPGLAALLMAFVLLFLPMQASATETWTVDLVYGGDSSNPDYIGYCGEIVIGDIVQDGRIKVEVTNTHADASIYAWIQSQYYGWIIGDMVEIGPGDTVTIDETVEEAHTVEFGIRCLTYEEETDDFTLTVEYDYWIYDADGELASSSAPVEEESEGGMPCFACCCPCLWFFGIVPLAMMPVLLAVRYW